MSLPIHPDAFEADWLAAKLGQETGALQGFSHEPVGAGQVGDSYRLHLNWAEVAMAPASLIAKCPAADTTSRETAHHLNLYEIETRFYQLYAGLSGARAPHAYLAEYDSASGDGLLLLEDMAPAKQIDQLAGGTVAQVELALNEAAALHSSQWNNQQLKGVPWLNYGSQEERQMFVEQLLTAVYPEWRERYQARIDADILKMGSELVARYNRFRTPVEGAPIVLSHGDLRLDNMLFTDSDGRAVLLDWQTLAAAAPMGDVAYCISTSLADASVRADCEENLVAHYHQRLNLTDQHYGLDRAWHDYRRASFAGFIMAVVSSMLVERTERGDEMFAVMAERSGWQALHLDALSLI